MNALTKKIIRLARRRDRSPRGLDNTFIDEPGMEAAIERAEAAMAERDWGRAAALWREVLDEFGDGAPRKAHLRLSRALRGDGQIVAAQAAVREGLKRYPEDLRLRRELAVERDEAATQQATAAQAVLLERWKRDPEDLRLRREFARPRPPSPARGIVSSADLAASKADWEEVARLWENLLGSRSTPGPEMVNGLAGALCQLGRFRDADNVLQRALAAGIDRRDIQSAFDSEVLRTQFLARFGQTAKAAVERGENRREWYRLSVGARRLRDASGLDAGVTVPSAIWVSFRGRFGNSVRELVNALDLAERLNVPRVYIPPTKGRRDTWYLDGNDPFYFRGREVIQSDTPSPEERLVLRGRFLVLRALSTALPGTDKPYRRLAELRPFTVFQDRQPLREDELVIHIRAGDVFQKRGSHKYYGQPPLAYYLTVLRHCRWRSVHLVYENDHNPVIVPLLDHLRAEGIDHTTVVTDLRSTIEFLLRAKTIVAGNGTFIPTIAGLSSNLRRLYSFDGRGQPGQWGCPGILQIDVIDDRGDYRRAVMSGNWENRPDQLRLMLQYPESALRATSPLARKSLNRPANS